jgi:hypothetical protein
MTVHSDRLSSLMHISFPFFFFNFLIFLPFFESFLDPVPYECVVLYTAFYCFHINESECRYVGHDWCTFVNRNKRPIGKPLRTA